MFTRGQDYERFMGRWSRRLAPLLASFAAVQPAERLLDVGTGTGVLAEELLRFAPARLAAVDPSAEFVTDADRRLRGRGVEFAVGDAMALDFADASFDRVLSLLALNFVPDAARAAREFGRVLRPGGVAAAATWDYAEGMQMLRWFWDAAATVDPATAARDERHMQCCTEGALHALFAEAGLRDVVVEPLVIEQPFAGFEDYWQPFLLGVGPAGALVARLEPPARERLRSALRERLLGGGPDRPLRLSARAWAVRGTR